METTPRAFIKLVLFTTGRRIFALRHVRAAAVALNLPDLVTHVDQATAHDRATRKLETQWRLRGDFDRRHAPEAQEVDNRLDQALTATRDVAATYARAAPLGSPRRETAERFLAKAFPDGVYPITSLPFVEQLAAVEDLLEVIATELPAEVAALGLGEMIALVAEITDEYRAVLDRGPSNVEYAEVQVARERGQTWLVELVVKILGHFPNTEDRAHEQARDELLGPILAQQKAIRRYLRERITVPDVDPDGEPDAATGEPPLEAPVEPPVIEGALTASPPSSADAA